MMNYQENEQLKDGQGSTEQSQNATAHSLDRVIKKAMDLIKRRKKTA